MENFDQKFLEEQKKKLLEEKKRVEEELADVAVKKDGRFEAIYPEYGSEDDENIQEIADYERNISIELSLKDLLAEIEKALSKIEKGTYGVCEKCGKLIEKERLQAVPYALFCLNCQKKEEK